MVLADASNTPPTSPGCSILDTGTNDKFEDPKEVILTTIKNRTRSIHLDTCKPGEEDSFFVADLGEVYRQHVKWKILLGRVIPFYAVKCNPNPRVLRLLAALGICFDCASVAEIQLVLNLGVDPSRMIFANPCKIPSAVQYAKGQGVAQIVFDSAEELHKLKRIYPQADLFLRIFADDPSAVLRFGAKFGAILDTTAELLDLAKELNLNVVGVSFHVGSGGRDPDVFIQAVSDARTVFDQALARGFKMHTLDIGGGFRGGDEFIATTASLNRILNKHFPPDIRIIAEPGRYFVESAFTLATYVITCRKGVPSDNPEMASRPHMLYLNDGVYSNLINAVIEGPLSPRILEGKDSCMMECDQLVDSPTTQEYCIWGRTCCGYDLINRSCKLPGGVEGGDWVFFEDAGAYSNACSSGFNGYANEFDIIYLCSEPKALASLDSA